MKKRSIRRLLLPLIAIAGVGYGVSFSLNASHEKATAAVPAPGAKPQSLPPSSSYNDSISGLGLIEANTRNIEIGSYLSGIVSEMLVTEGDLVKKGQPLFRLDDRTARSDIVTMENDQTTAEAQLEEAKVNLADQQDQYKRVEGLKEGFAVTADRVARLRFAQRAAASKIEVTKASIEAAKARVSEAKTTLEKLTVTAPVDGRIFKVNIRPGEFVQAGINNVTPIVMGNDTPLHVRVTIDENDLWRFNKAAEATGSLRSNRDIKFPLTFVRVEPYVQPKTSLTGSTSERVDTRVMEVVYSIAASDAPVYIGQQVDVFIKATPVKKP